MEVVPINSFIDEFNYLASFERLKYVSPALRTLNLANVSEWHAPDRFAGDVRQELARFF